MRCIGNMKIDIHIHSNLSACSTMSLEEIFEAALAAGLNGVCISDHYTGPEGREYPRVKPPEGLFVCIAMEYSSPDGDFLLFGDFDDLEEGLSGEDLLLTVEERGGLAVAAHPCRGNRPVAERLFEKGLCRVVERLNGRNTSEENGAVDSLIERYDLYECGGSDAHEVHEVGMVMTEFERDITTEKDLIAALREGAGEGRYNSKDLVFLT